MPSTTGCTLIDAITCDLTQPKEARMDNLNQLRIRAASLFQANRLDEARNTCEQVLQSAPRDLDALNLLSIICGMQGNYPECEKFCRKALKIKPNTIAIVNNLGNALKFQKKHTEAKKLYKKVITLDPRHADAYSNLGSIHWQQGNNEEALKCYRKALNLNPDNINALTNLGILLQENDDFEGAASHYSRAEALNPNNLDLIYNISTFLSKQQKHEKVHDYLKKLLALSPAHVKGWQLLATTLHKLKDTSTAIDCFRRAIEIDPDDADAYLGLGLVLNEAGRKEEATEAFVKILEMDPSHEEASFWLAILGKQAIPAQCPKDYVSSLFNNYADIFDQHLVNKLEYGTPERLRELFNTGVQPVPGHLSILDLGCGTGLSGAAFQDIAGYMAGIDLSEKMIDKAKARDIYDELIVDDIVSGMAKISRRFDLAICVDTFIYVGDLGEAVEKTACMLEDDGHFAFSIEKLDENSNYRLNETGRYSHSESYIRQILKANRLNVIAVHDGILRKEDNVPMLGQYFIARKVIQTC